MFDLKDKTGYSKSTMFYEYAKSLAILRENLLNHQEPPGSPKRVVDQVTEAMGVLVEQVQRDNSSESWVNPVARKM